jgi:DNA-directed RNA polymerase specialized sigma24 family protein
MNKIDFPTPEFALNLHCRWLENDPLASQELAEALFEPLYFWLQRQFPHVSPDLVQTAAVDAFMDYLRRPLQYDSSRSSLVSYLCNAARCDLLNELRRERRHSRVVELTECSGNEECQPLEGLIQHEQQQHAREQLDTLRDTLSAIDQQVLDLLMAGERRTVAYAEVLGLADAPAAEQERESKRAKDRVKKRIRRGISDESAPERFRPTRPS